MVRSTEPLALPPGAVPAVRGSSREDDGFPSEGYSSRAWGSEISHDPEEAQVPGVHLVKVQLKQMQEDKRPQIPTEPAEQLDFIRAERRVPSALVMAPPETAFSRLVNSTVGRLFTFMVTLVLFLGSVVGILSWQAPQHKLAQTSLPILWVSLGGIFIMYTLIPGLAIKAGMKLSREGVDWKPYLVFYRCSYLTAVPALFCLNFGYGAKTGFGSAAPPNPRTQTLIMTDLEPGTLNYFEATDGFVALNLTKGVLETVQVTEHGTGDDPQDPYTMRKSRFRDAEFRINKEPYSDVPEPTIPPGMVKIYRVAPIFQTWDVCLTRYRISPACLRKNSVVGWAFAETHSFCSDIAMVSCESPIPVLDPVYKCSSGSPIHGEAYTGGDAVGLCGRVIEPPELAALDELGAILLLDGWPAISLPNASHVWVNVYEDACISDPQGCLAQWDSIGSIGAIFVALTVICILVPAYLDIRIDSRIRNARSFFQESQMHRPKMVSI